MSMKAPDFMVRGDGAMQINCVESIEVTWGHYDEITDTHQFSIGGSRRDLALVWDILEYHLKDNPKLAVRSIGRLRLDIDMPVKDASASLDIVQGLYDQMMNVYPAGYNPFKPSNRW